MSESLVCIIRPSRLVMLERDFYIFIFSFSTCVITMLDIAMIWHR